MGMLIACNLLLPVLLIAIGALMKKRPPEKINALYGYRTERSMKNADTWRFANDYSGALIWKIGWRALIAAIPLTERALKAAFDDEGRRKQ